jgi:ABC-2 type transport system ATP-binding protein
MPTAHRRIPAARPGRPPQAAPGGGEAPGPILACTDLAFAYGRHLAVSRVSFVVRPGEAYGLLGPAGAGKTTTLRLACGALAPDAGFVDARGAVGYAAGDVALFPTLSVSENLQFWAAAHGVARRDRPQRVRDALRLVGLGDLPLHRPLGRRPPGVERRLHLAAALLHRPALVALDDPGPGLDAEARATLVDVLERLRAAGTALLVTGRRLDEVMGLCDRVGLVDRGRLHAELTPVALVAEYGATAGGPHGAAGEGPSCGPDRPDRRGRPRRPDRQPPSTPVGPVGS